MEKPGTAWGGRVAGEGGDGLRDEVDVVAEHAVGATWVDGHGGDLRRGEVGGVPDGNEGPVGVGSYGMSAEGAETGGGGDSPVAAAEGRDAGTDSDDFEAAFVTRDSGGGGCAQEGRESGLDAVGALDGIDVRGVDRHGEGAEEHGAGGERGGYGVRVKVEDLGRFAELGEDEGLGLGVAVGAGAVAAWDERGDDLVLVLGTGPNRTRTPVTAAPAAGAENGARVDERHVGEWKLELLTNSHPRDETEPRPSPL